MKAEKQKCVLRNLENAAKGQVLVNKSVEKRLEAIEAHAVAQEWIDAKDTPPVADTNELPIWATINKDGFRFVELVVFEEGMGWSITDDHRGELVRCEVVGEITHWMPQHRPLYPAHGVQRADKETSPYSSGYRAGWNDALDETKAKLFDHIVRKN